MTPERWRRIEELYQAAQERGAGERDVFLAEACDGDEELRREVAALLAQESDGHILDRPAAELLPAASGSLAPGAKLGPYEILSRIGAGGMGTVYKARDPRVGRSVAIKVTSGKFSGRFAREARAIAALNHPHICTLYDVGRDYLVMEYVDGRPVRGPLPLPDALRLALQLLDALDAAHRQGIVHRDLKPANILATKAGVKVLDFGLAKMESGVAADTGNETLTQRGAIMGTLRYMSPEQVQGKDVDSRSDLFSFGLVLYEMITGQRAFEAENSASVIAAILARDPVKLEEIAPAGLQRVLRRCLAKDPAERWQSATDLKAALELVEVGPAAAAAPQAKRQAPRWLKWAAVGLGAIALAVGAWRLAPRHHGFENYRYTPIEISRESPWGPIWAPDGKAFSYSARVEGQWQVFVRYLNSSTAAQITHDANFAYDIGWSPDSKRIFIVRQTSTEGTKPATGLYSLSVTGGEPEFVMPVDLRGTARVSPDGKVLTALSKEADGTFSVVTASPVGSALQRYSPAPFETKQLVNVPHLLMSPDNTRILYFVNRNGQEEAWNLPFPAGSGTPKQILKDLPHYGGTPEFTWLPDSRHIVVSLEQEQGEGTHLWMVDTVSGSRSPLTTGLFIETTTAVSPSGKQVLFLEVTTDYKLVSVSLEDASVRTLIASQRRAGMPAWAQKVDKFVYQTNRSGVPEIWLHESDGAERAVVTPGMFPAGSTKWWMNPALSPSADRVAYTRVGTNGDHAIWISALAGGPPVRLTNVSAGGTEHMAVWSPDGGRIAYLRHKGGIWYLMICKTSGQAAPVELRAKVGMALPDWSPTGEWISFGDESGWNLISPDGKSVRALGRIGAPTLTFSKDGKSIGEPTLTFSKDGKTVYWIRTEDEHQYLSSHGIAEDNTGSPRKTIGDVGTDFTPRSYLYPGVRLSLSPDGKSILYPTYSAKTSLWMLEGFDAP